MVVRIGINGFGRIGRVIFRTCVQSEDLEVTAINDPAVDIDYICYLIKFDSTHGKFKSGVTFSEDTITIDDKKIKVFCEKLPSSIPWQAAAVQYVVEASGMFTSREKASGHLESGSVKRVIVTAPTVDVPMLILGVNNHQIDIDNSEQRVISCASSTLYCLAPIVKILEDNYGVAEGFITSIHAMTPSLKPLDGLCLKGKHWRDHRSIHQNIIPAATGACKALGKIIPSMKDKLTGLAFRVPIVNVSVLDITVRLNKNTTLPNIIKCIEAESKSTMRNIIKIAKDQEVSSDFLGDEHSCIFDLNSSLQLNPKFFKLICWYENEYSYACRVVDSIKYSEENLDKLNKISELINVIIPSINSVPTRPIQNFNKEYVVSNCHTSSNPKIMLKSQGNPKIMLTSHGIRSDLSPSSTNYERPLENSEFKQLVLCDSKERNDIFEVWNDETQITRPVKENKNSNFQSCVISETSFTQSNNYIKTKERLEEVKKEFSKMSNMTKKILKISNQSKCEVNCLEEELYRDDVKKDKKDTERELYTTRLSLPTVIKLIPTNRGFQNSIGGIYKDTVIAHKKEVSDTAINKNASDHSDTPNVDANGLNEKVLIKSNNVFSNVKIPDRKSIEPCLSCQDDETMNPTKATDDLDDQENFKPEDIACIPNKKLCTATSYNNKINLVTDSFAHKVDLWNCDLCTKTISNREIKNAKVIELKIKNTKLADDKLIKTNTEKLSNNDIKHEEIKQITNSKSKPGATLIKSFKTNFNYDLTKNEDVINLNRRENQPDVISSKSNKDNTKTPNESDLNKTKLTVTYINPESSELEKDGVATLSVSRNEIGKKILGGIMKILTARALDNKTRNPSLVTTNTTTCNREVYKSLDLYDKLDSASASDSDNSFQINEKTSQVIDVTDLTSSAEELSRLDKICRIIEISDEMSDKLFSALNNNDNNNIKKKKWSFKDLCERLKLDEFCNNVFGEPSSLDK